MVRFVKRVGVLAVAVTLLVTMALGTGAAMNRPVGAYRGDCPQSGLCLMDISSGISMWHSYPVLNADWLPDLSAAVFISQLSDEPDSTLLIRYDRISDQSTHINTDPTVKSFASWSPDGAYIAYVMWEEDNEQIRLQIVTAAGTPHRDPLPVTGSTARGIKWAPGGERLLYNATAGPQSRSTYIYDLTSGIAREVCEGPTGHASWSPDGAQVVCATRSIEGDQLQFINADDGSTRHMALVTDPPDAVLFPVWSPDGTQVAYVEQQPGAAHFLRVYDLTTGEHRSVSDMQFGALSEPLWLNNTRILQTSLSFFMVVNTTNKRTRTVHPDTLHDFYGVVAW